MARIENPVVTQGRVSSFFVFDQNNSSGTFDIDDRVAPWVIIEANCADDANTYAKNIGIYFDGCAKGIDCSCCGDRWQKQYSAGPQYKTLNEVEADWSTAVKRYDAWTHDRSRWGKKGEPYVHIYTLDGRKITFTKDK